MFAINNDQIVSVILIIMAFAVFGSLIWSYTKSDPTITQLDTKYLPNANEELLNTNQTNNEETTKNIGEETTKNTGEETSGTIETFYGNYYPYGYPYDYPLPYYYPYFYSGCNENVFGEVRCLPPMSLGYI